MGDTCSSANAQVATSAVNERFNMELKILTDQVTQIKKKVNGLFNEPKCEKPGQLSQPNVLSFIDLINRNVTELNSQNNRLTEILAQLNKII